MIKLILKALITSIRPLLGPAGCCRFELTCSDYAFMQLNEAPLWKAIPSIIKRLVSCSPFGR